MNVRMKNKSIVTYKIFQSIFKCEDQNKDFQFVDIVMNNEVFLQDSSITNNYKTFFKQCKVDNLEDFRGRNVQNILRVGSWTTYLQIYLSLTTIFLFYNRNYGRRQTFPSRVMGLINNFNTHEFILKSFGLFFKAVFAFL